MTLPETWALVSRAIGAMCGHTQDSDELLDVLVEREQSIWAALMGRSAEDRELCARTLVALGSWLRPLWCSEDAVTLCERLCALEWQDQSLRQRLELLRARQLHKHGEPQDACERLRVLSQDHFQDRHLRVDVLNELGVAFMLCGDSEQALAHCHKALTMATQMDFDSGVAVAHLGIAKTMSIVAEVIQEAQMQRIMEHLEHAITFSGRAKNRQIFMRSYGEWSGIMCMRDLDEAEQATLKVGELADELRLPSFRLLTDLTMIDIQLSRENLYGAEALISSLDERVARDDVKLRLFLEFQRLTLLLHSCDSTRLHECFTRIVELHADYDNPQVARRLFEMEIVIAVLCGHFERFEVLRTRPRPVTSPMCEGALLLGEVLQAHQAQTLDEDTQCVDEFVDVLIKSDEFSRFSAFIAPIWRHGIRYFPERLVPLRAVITMALAPDMGWLITANGIRQHVSHRPYLYRMLKTLVGRHAQNMSGIHTFDLFEQCWPGETASLEVMKNRVYVGISNLKKLGLRDMLIRDEQGYLLVRDLTVVICIKE